MKELHQTILGLRKLLNEVPDQFKELTKAQIEHKPDPFRWSKKEIIGHLCDSCTNNLQRIIRVQYEDKPAVIYNQDQWVKIQKYQNMSGHEILALWKNLHQQFVRVLEGFPESRLESIIDVGQEVTAHFLITDYLDHQHHHLKHVFGM